MRVEVGLVAGTRRTKWFFLQWTKASRESSEGD